MRTLLALIFGLASFRSSAMRRRPQRWLRLPGYGSSKGTRFGFKLTKMGRPINAASLSTELVYASTGTVVAPSSIHWRQIWGIDQVSLQVDTMVLKGPYGAFRYQRALQAMAPACVVASSGLTFRSRRTPPAPLNSSVRRLHQQSREIANEEASGPDRGSYGFGFHR
jgi:hypothetical protein